MAANNLMMRLQMQLADKVSGPLQKMAQASLMNVKALKENRNRLRDLEKQSGLIQKLKLQQEAFKRAGNEMRVNSANLNALKQSGAASAAQIKAQTALVDKSTQAFNKQKDKLLALRSAATAAGIGKLADDEKRLSGEITKTTQQIGRQEAALRRMDALREQRNSGLKAAAGVGAAGLGMRMLGTRGLNASRNMIASTFDFDAAMADLQGKFNLAGNSAELAALREQIKSFNQENAVQLAGALQQLAQEGFTLQQAMGAVPALIQTADASTMNLQDTAASFAGVMKGFNLSYDEFAGISDKIIGASNAGGIAVDKLNEALAGIAPTARASGFSLEETAAMLGTLNRAGISTSDSVTALEGVMRNLQNPNTKALAAIGIRPGQVKTMQELLAAISSKTAGMSDLKQLETLSGIFGSKNAAVMSQLMAQMRSGGMNTMFDAINNSGGATAALAAQNTNHLKDTTEDLQASIANLKQELVDLNKEWLRDLARMAINVVASLRAWIKENPGLAKTLGVVFIVGSALLTALGSLLAIAAPLIGSYVMMRFAFAMLGVKGFTLFGILGKLGLAFKAVGMAILSTPIGWLIAALAGLAFAIYKNWDAVVWFFRDTWDNIKTFFSSGIDNIAATILNWSPLGLFYQVFAGVLSWFGIDLPESFSTFAMNIITGFGEGVLGMGAWLWDTLIDVFGGVFNGVFDWFTDMPARFMEMGGQIIDGLIDGIKGAAGAVKDAVVNTAENVVGWFKGILGIKSPSRVFMDAGLNISEGAAIGITNGLPRVKRATEALGREARPRFEADTRSPVSPASVRSVAPAIGGDTYHFHIHGATDPQAVAREIENVLNRRDAMKRAQMRSSYKD